jgi:hypothetical protein
VDQLTLFGGADKIVEQCVWCESTRLVAQKDYCPECYAVVYSCVRLERQREETTRKKSAVYYRAWVLGERITDEEQANLRVDDIPREQAARLFREEWGRWPNDYEGMQDDDGSDGACRADDRL